MSEKQDWREVLREVVEEKRRHLGPHPRPEQLLAYQAGELKSEETKNLLDHLVLCPQCAKLLLDLESFAADSADSDSFPAQDPDPDHRPSAEITIPPNKPDAWRRRLWMAPLAAAALLLILVLAWPTGEPLPSYSARLTGFVQTTRTAPEDPGEVYVFPFGSQLTLTLQPETALHAPPTARAYLRHGEAFRALSGSTLEARKDGVVRLQGTVGSDLFLPSGESNLIVAVARLGNLPSRDQLAASDLSRDRQWIAPTTDIRVIGSPASPRAAASAEPWVEYAGCRTILAGPVCILKEDRTLTLWVRHERQSQIRIHAGLWTSRSGTPAGRGFRFNIEVGQTQEVVVEVVTEEKRLIWALEVADQPLSEELGKARQLYESGPYQEAAPLLRQIAESGTPEAGFALSLLARLERDNNQLALSEHYYRQALDAHRQAGHLFDEVRDVAGLSFQLIRERRFTEVRQLLNSVSAEDLGGSALARYYFAYHSSRFAQATGDLRAARRYMSQAAQAAERAGLTLAQLFADDIIALQLASAGLWEAAEAVYLRIGPPITERCRDPSALGEDQLCDCARFAVNRAWAGLLALEASRTLKGVNLEALLRQAERILSRDAASLGSCLTGEELANVRLNWALWALHQGKFEKAREQLERAGDAASFARLALWQLEIEARIRLEDGQPAHALGLYLELARRADSRSSPEASWRAAFGRAKALQALGNRGQAIEACLQAEKLVDQESLLVPMDQGRELFIAQRSRATRFCLDLLLRDGRTEEALAAIRRSAASALRSLRTAARMAELEENERRQWEQVLDTYQKTRAEMEDLTVQIGRGLPLDQEKRLRAEVESKRRDLRGLLDEIASLGEPQGQASPDLEAAPAGSLLLAFHPLPRGWAALAADEQGVRAESIGPLADLSDLPALSIALLKPFSRQIEQAAEIRVVSYGDLRHVDFHALPFGRGVLLEQAPVAYQLDLPASPLKSASPSLALLVSGPGLLQASKEAAKVSRALRSGAPSGRRIEWLQGESASVSQVRQGMPEAALFHYAGHAEFDPESRGWDSYLALHGGGRLTIDDILALPRVPRWAVLSGCQTGRDSRAASLPSIGLAQAFLAAGSEAVLAATADISDADAAALGEALYRHWGADSASLSAALQKAQLELRKRAPDSDWSKFRVLVR
ncbi:MAG TPA: CHAT domain-containing protein [Acidobacteriota bacterium]|nr:CHAT domain-containing protein [Acidobacteriota bacterium]